MGEKTVRNRLRFVVWALFKVDEATFLRSFVERGSPARVAEPWQKATMKRSSVLNPRSAPGLKLLFKMVGAPFLKGSMWIVVARRVWPEPAERNTILESGRKRPIVHGTTF